MMSEQHPQGGGLAGPVRADEAEHGAGLDPQVERVQGDVRAVALVQRRGLDSQVHDGGSSRSGHPTRVVAVGLPVESLRADARAQAGAGPGGGVGIGDGLLLALVRSRSGGAREGLRGGVEHPLVGVEAVGVELQDRDGEAAQDARAHRVVPEGSAQLTGHDQRGDPVEGHHGRQHLRVARGVHHAGGGLVGEHLRGAAQEGVEEPVGGRGVLLQGPGQVVDRGPEPVEVGEPVRHRGRRVRAVELLGPSDELLHDGRVAALA